MSALDDILKTIPSTINMYDDPSYDGTFADASDYDNYYEGFNTLMRPKVTSTPKSKMTLLIQDGTLEADTYFPFSYRGEKFESLREMCDFFWLDVVDVIRMVERGMSFAEAISKAEDFADCSELIEQKRMLKEKRKAEADAREERRKEMMFVEDINQAMRVVNRDVNTSGLRDHIHLLGTCRRDFLKVFSSTLHSSDKLDLRNIRDLPRCDVSQFVLAVEKFFNTVTQDLGITKTKEDLLKAYYHSMWVDGIDHSDAETSRLAKEGVDRDLYELMSEREQLIISNATGNAIYNYLERNNRTFPSSTPITAKTVEGWYENLSKVSNIPVEYIKYFTDDGNSVDKVLTCQKLKYIVKLNAGVISCWGFMKLEYYFDVYVDKLIKEIDLERVDVNAPLDVTEFVKDNSALHKTSWRNEVSGHRQELTLFGYYNKMGYDITGVEYTAGELAQDPNMILEK